MKVIWINYKGKKRDITKIVKSVAWSGSVSQVARQLDISVLHGPNDINITKQKVMLRNGDIVRFYDDKGKQIYEGQVFHTSKQSEAGSITYNTFDYAQHLLKSTATKKYKKQTAEKITKSLCKEFKISIGNIAVTRKQIKKLICEDTSIYEMIMRAYTKASKTTHKKYILRMKNKKLNVYTSGSKVQKFELSDKKNISNITYEESAENVVNQVVVYSEKGKKIATIKDRKSIETFGIFQSTYTKEKGTNYKTAAKALLEGVEKTISVEVIEGNINCIAGNGVKVHDAATGLNALFWIESDSHTWENGRHTMSLELLFKKVWDKQEDG